MQQVIPPTHPDPWPRFRLGPATGAVELALGAGVEDSGSRPARVTAILAALLAEVAGEAASPALLRRLSVGAREWLLQQVAATCRSQPDWFDCTCPGCGAGFDMALDLSALPRAPVPEGFPAVTVQLGGRALIAQVPNGAVEEALAEGGLTGVAAMRACLAMCLVDPADGAALDGAEDETIRRLDAMLDAATPDCADTVATVCPDCGQAVAARIDPLDFAFPRVGGVLRDVHLLGRAYHWSEAEILALPTARRRSYVAMIAGAAPHETGARA